MHDESTKDHRSAPSPTGNPPPNTAARETQHYAPGSEVHFIVIHGNHDPDLAPHTHGSVLEARTCENFTTKSVEYEFLRVARNQDSAAMPELATSWDTYAYFLPRKARVEIYEPALCDLKAEFLEAQVRASTPARRRQVLAVFGFRSKILVLQCYLACGRGIVLRVLKYFGLKTLAVIIEKLLC
jgi:hypothetical protein